MPSLAASPVESVLVEEDQLVDESLLNAKDGESHMFFVDHAGSVTQTRLCVSSFPATEVTEVLITAFLQKRVYQRLGEQALISINPGTINQGEHDRPSDTSIM